MARGGFYLLGSRASHFSPATSPNSGSASHAQSTAACPVRRCREEPRQMSMSHFSGFQANVATQHDIWGLKIQANVATCYWVTDTENLLARAARARSGTNRATAFTSRWKVLKFPRRWRRKARRKQPRRPKLSISRRWARFELHPSAQRSAAHPQDRP